MPNLSSNLSSIRTPGHRIRGYVSFIVPRALCTGEVDSSNFNVETGRYSQLDISSTTGTFNVSLWDCEIEFFDGISGLSKGRTRISREVVPTSSLIAIPETSLANLDIDVNDTFIIYDEVRIHPRIPSDTEAFAPDNQTYTSQTQNLAPVANSGLSKTRFVDKDTDIDGNEIELDYATIEFDGSESYSVDPDSNDSNLAHYWYFGTDCTPEDSTSESPSVEIPVGTRWVYHEVTDTGAGNAFSIQRIPVAVHDSTNPPYDATVNNYTGNLLSGWAASVTIKHGQGISHSDIPNGSAAVIWADETTGSYGAMQGDSSVKLFGYIDSEDEYAEYAIDDVTFPILSPIAILNKVVGFSQALILADSGFDWQHYNIVTINVVILSLLRFYSTILTVCDINNPVYDINYPAFYVRKQTPLGQVREIIDAIDGRLTMDKRGFISIHTDPDLLPLELRATQTVTLELTADDIIDISVSVPHRKVVDTVELQGITFNTQIPIFAIYPSTATNEGTFAETVDRLIVWNAGSGVDANMTERSGRRGARIDRVFIDEDGIQYFAPTIELTLRGSYDVFDFYDDYIELNLALARNNNLDVFLHHLTAVTINYANGTAETKLTLQAATHAPPGELLSPPNAYLGSAGAWPNVALLMSDGRLYRTTNFDKNSVSYSDIGVIDSGSMGTIKAAMRELQDTNFIWCVGDDKLYFVEGMHSGTPTPTEAYDFNSSALTKYKITRNRARLDLYAVSALAIGSPLFDWDFANGLDGFTIIQGLLDGGGYIATDPGSGFSDVYVRYDFASTVTLVAGEITFNRFAVSLFRAYGELECYDSTDTLRPNALGSTADDANRTPGGSSPTGIVTQPFTANGSTSFNCFPITGVDYVIIRLKIGTGAGSNEHQLYNVMFDTGAASAGFSLLVASDDTGATFTEIDQLGDGGDSATHEAGAGVAIANDGTTMLGGSDNDSAIIGYYPSATSEQNTGLLTFNAGDDYYSLEDIISPFKAVNFTPTYIVAWDIANEKRVLFRVTADGLFIDITPDLGGEIGAIGIVGSVVASDDNPMHIMVVGAAFTDGNASFVSANGGDSWRVITTVGEDEYQFGHIEGHNLYVWGANGSVGYGRLPGGMISNKSGNIIDSDTVIGLVGKY